jgi:hypothetical protein
MSNTCIVLKNIENVAQLVANLIPNPALLPGANTTSLINQLELVIGSVRELPLTAIVKTDIINRFVEAQLILQDLTLTSIERLLTVLQLLSLTTLKVGDHRVPCSQGLTHIHPSNTFNTICNCCR